MSPRLNADIKTDEELIFFPTLGHYEQGSGLWHLTIHGWIFKPEIDSRRRAAAVGLLRRWLHLEPSGVEAKLFDERIRAFLVDNLPRKAITVRLGRQQCALTRSTANGHLIDVLTLPAGVVADALAAQRNSSVAQPLHESWLPFDVIVPAGDSRSFRGAVQMVAEEGLSVISDIDDTIKITHVRDRSALLRQTFLRDFEAVPGMAQVYARWQAAGASFHYVTRSPWQLYPPLADFIAIKGFPAGTYHMRHFRWKNASTLQPDRTGAKKQAVIDGIMSSLPRRQFVCVGDSGEHDPEIYGALARRFSSQVRGIFIRNVTGEDASNPRFTQAFAGLPAERWRLFEEPSELPLAIA
jgi:phosphatidate phosphatase APP1